MAPEGPLDPLRSLFARDIVAGAAAAGTSLHQRLLAAFSIVPREDFVGPAPWRLFGGGMLPSTTDDPRLLYDDVLVSLAADRGINNGQPSLHARAIAAAAPAAGETVVHVGAGTGYYTAILAELVGPQGRVVAYEIEPDLAARAASCLRRWPQVSLVAGSATGGATLPACDVLYVSAGATHPLPQWLDALNPGGRLVLPLTLGDGWGCMLQVTRIGSGGYAARALMRVAFIPCIGARDEVASRSLAAALAARDPDTVRSLRRGSKPDETAWCVGEGWWLSTAEPEG